MNNECFLRMEAIHKRFGGTVALRNVCMSAALGEVHAVVGENGAGKSTLMNILSGAVTPDSGTIARGGRTVVLGTPHEANRLGIRAVHQEFSLVRHLTIAENILMGKMPTRGAGRVWVDWAGTNRRARSILDSLGFPHLDVRTRISRLSVSHQQIVEIAKALAEKPSILILDEPSAVLSKDELALLFSLIRRLAAENTLVIYISHRLEEVFEIANRITVLRDGVVVGTVNRDEVDQNALIRMMVGRSVEEIYPARAARPAEEILSVRSLGRVGEFRDVSFTLHGGEVVGVFGLVGSGRTAVARSIFGAEPPTSGSVFLDGREVHLKSPQDAVNAGISFVTEDRKRDGLVMSCTLRDNISLATLRHMSHGLILDRRRQDRMVQSKVNDLAIRPSDIGQKARTLSGGNQQKVVIAKWLLSHTRVLLLDEPTRGVDIGAKVEIYHIINGLVEAGIGVLLISSEMSEVRGMSDRIIVMREGRLVGNLTRAEADEETLLQYAAGMAGAASVHARGTT
jgi:ABC-type sugar transport system ATPase subunit